MDELRTLSLWGFFHVELDLYCDAFASMEEAVHKKYPMLLKPENIENEE